ncbi:MAG: sulfotransferase [Planctomycetota bacterium]
MIDAHPNALIAHELDVFARNARGRVTGHLRFSDRKSMFDAILAKSAAQAKAGRGGSRISHEGKAYRVSYAVPRHYQGRFTELRVIGNKRGQSTAEAIRKNPRALEDLRGQAGLPVNLLHVVRNPFDNIATKYAALTEGARWKAPFERYRSILLYFRKAEAVAMVKRAGFDVLDVFLEQLIAQPEPQIRRVCRFLGLEPYDDYVKDCAGILLESPHHSGGERSWTRHELGAIRRWMRRFPWLARYESMEPVCESRGRNADVR